MVYYLSMVIEISSLERYTTHLLFPSLSLLKRTEVQYSARSRERKIRKYVVSKISQKKSYKRSSSQAVELAYLSFCIWLKVQNPKPLSPFPLTELLRYLLPNTSFL